MTPEQAKESGTLLQAREAKLDLLNAVKVAGGRTVRLAWQTDGARERSIILAGEHNTRLRDETLEALRRDIDDIDVRLHQLGVDLVPPAPVMPRTQGAVASDSLAALAAIPKTTQHSFRAGSQPPGPSSDGQAVAQHQTIKSNRPDAGGPAGEAAAG